MSDQLKTKKLHLLLWYQCLQMCIRQWDTYGEALVASKPFYAEWGISGDADTLYDEILITKFDDWWHKHKKKLLFEDVRTMETDRISQNPNSLTLNIPLNETTSNVLADVKRILEKRRAERLDELGLKSVRDYKTKYGLNAKELKGNTIYTNLEMYKLWFESGKPPINRKFVRAVREEFDVRKRSSLKNLILHIPSAKQFETTFQNNASLDDVIRSVRRSIKGIEKTLGNVAQSQFP